ncbi:hypothetical protein NEMBOFW57_008398 [Staphylotrichum longicolle]|uniref:Uncharacterized protein n=1 Tax=Staphylotrichum longicolle TaxID=669026 RepID=A0AAD4HX62_9PEZI|nr:hypothetical protein NEMBOFW57_008398 [Staphylotrichum longicolle]
MADSGGGSFPLAGEGHAGGGDIIDGNVAGAAGPSTGGVVLSRGALIAIIVVVVVVALFGSGLSSPSQSRRDEEAGSTIPPTPRIKPEYLDLEKGLDKPKKKRANFGRK